MAHHDHLHAAVLTGIATELRLLRVELERMAELLVSDCHFATLYLDQLQAFDFLGQCADESAAVLDRLSQGVAAPSAITEVRLDTMLHRLRASLPPPQAQAA